MQVRHVSYRAHRSDLLRRHVAPLVTPGFWFHDLSLNGWPGFELVWSDAAPQLQGPWLEIVPRDVPLAPHPTEAYCQVLAIDTVQALEELAGATPAPHWDVFFQTLDKTAPDLLWRWLLGRRLQRDDLPDLPPSPAFGPPPSGYAARLEPWRGQLDAMALARLAHVQWLRIFGPDSDPLVEIACAWRLAQQGSSAQV
ncbi:MAG TPA: hypothetical protein VGO93_27775, partial [Candidatus Xenobia bacterium]